MSLQELDIVDVESYRALLDTIDAGFSVVEVLFDAAGQPVDYRVLQVNRAHRRLTGLEYPVGKTARQIIPSLEGYWIERFGRVAATGEPTRFVDRVAGIGRVFDVRASRFGRPEDRRVAILFDDVTEQTRAADALRDAEARLHRMMEIETVGVIFFRADGAITYANDAFLRMSGYSREDAERGLVRWDTMTPPEWMPPSLRAIDEFLTLGRTTPYEKEYIRKDGSRWWALFAAARLNDEEGVEYVIDITAAKRAEAQRRLHEDRYRLLFESIDEGFCIIEVLFDAAGQPVDYRFLETNPAFEQQTGLRDAVGKRMRELAPDHEEHWFAIYGQVAMTGEPVRFVNEAQALGGRWFDVNAFRLGGEGSRTVAILFNDITERQRTESALREGEERLRRAVEAARTVVWEWDPGQDRVTATDSIADVYGVSAVEFAEQGFALVHVEDRERHQATVQRAATEGGEYHSEFRIVRPDTGATIWIEERAAAITDAAGRVARLVGVAADITERKRLERTQQDFVAMASHDLATPVTVLRARAQLMQRRQTYDEAGMETIIEQTARMERLIADLRDLVRLDVGQIELHRAPVDLGELAREAAERVRVQATAHVVRCECPACPVRGEWDPDRLGQVLDNLLNNAVKYSRAGGAITLRVDAIDNEARVSVTDEGEGIPPEVLPHLFERYYRAERSESSSGLGIGLYISRMLVAAHGGRIWAESVAGQGSTFTVALPV